MPISILLAVFFACCPRKAWNIPPTLSHSIVSPGGACTGTTNWSLALPALAQDKEPTGPFGGNIAATVGFFTDYKFRGVSQTNEKPAVQGGFDLGHKSGLYAGVWGSNVSWISDSVPDASASVELDFYGGYKFGLPADFSGDVGVLYYWYTGSYPSGMVKPNTTELYGALTWKFVTLKYSYSLGDTFGFDTSSGSDYLELNAAYDIVDKVNDTIGKVTLEGHVGNQRFKGFSDFDYTDWKVGASTDILGTTVGIFVTGTDAEEALYTNRFGKQIADTQFVGYIKKTF